MKKKINFFKRWNFET